MDKFIRKYYVTHTWIPAYQTYQDIELLCSFMSYIQTSECEIFDLFQGINIWAWFDGTISHADMNYLLVIKFHVDFSVSLFVFCVAFNVFCRLGLCFSIKAHLGTNTVTYQADKVSLVCWLDICFLTVKTEKNNK